MKPARLIILGAASTALALILVFTRSGQGQGTLPASDIAKLIALDAKFIEADLSKPTFTKKAQKHVRLAAFMIALYAQNAKDDAPAMATLREQALKVMIAADAGNAEETKKLAATLTPGIKADPAAKTGPVAMEKLIELEALMSLFNPEKSSGFNMEKDLEDLVESKGMGLDAVKLEKTALLGQKVALIALVTQAHSPKTPLDAANKKVWVGIAGDMNKEANALTAAARANKTADIAKIAKNINDTCTKCHDSFR
jgi:Cytochrome C'